jgi:hypothetical protein
MHEKTANVDGNDCRKNAFSHPNEGADGLGLPAVSPGVTRWIEAGRRARRDRGYGLSQRERARERPRGECDCKDGNRRE